MNRSKKAPDGMLQCTICGASTAIKSNRAIQEELERISAYLTPLEEPSCPTAGCGSTTKGVFSHPDAYVCKAILKSSRRMKCKSCGTIFPVSTSPSHRQRKPHENKTVFKEIVTNKPIRGIAKMTEMRPKSVYGKIDFIYRRCLGFLGQRWLGLSGQFEAVF